MAKQNDMAYHQGYKTPYKLGVCCHYAQQGGSIKAAHAAAPPEQVAVSQVDDVYHRRKAQNTPTDNGESPCEFLNVMPTKRTKLTLKRDFVCVHFAGLAIHAVCTMKLLNDTAFMKCSCLT